MINLWELKGIIPSKTMLKATTTQVTPSNSMPNVTAIVIVLILNTTQFVPNWKMAPKWLFIRLVMLAVKSLIIR
uniref:Uncharacterized protein n=1 Tax=Acrobeloides nanus TaxID=290746 RepID=A0A914D1X0_9BILA